MKNLKGLFRVIGSVSSPLAMVITFAILTIKTNFSQMLLLTMLFLVGFAVASSFLPRIRFKSGVIFFFAGTVMCIISMMPMLMASFWVGLIFVLSSFLSIFLLVFLVLAPRDIFFTFVEEGTARAVVRGKQFQKALIQWKGYTLDKDWNVVKGTEFHILGGIRFFGLWPLDKIYTYEFEWKGLQPDGITARPHAPEKLKHIFLKQYIYLSEVKKAEDSQRLPLDIRYVLTIQNQNPYKALFRVHNWLAATFGRIAPEIRNVVGKGDYKTLIGNLGGIAEQIKDNIAKQNIVQILLDDYGVEIKDTKILTIDPPEDLREATLVEFKAELEKKRLTTEAEGKKAEKVRQGEGEAEAFKAKIDALGGGKDGIERLVAIEISKNIKDGDKIVIDNLYKISELFTKRLVGG